MDPVYLLSYFSHSLKQFPQYKPRNHPEEKRLDKTKVFLSVIVALIFS